MGEVDEAFEGLKRNLEITPTEADLAKKRHHLVRDHVEARWACERTFLTGSYDRHTKTKPLKDVDIFAVLDPDGEQAHLREGTGRAAVEALAHLLGDRWPDVNPDDYVATIGYAGEEVASYEIAPVFPRADGGYWMPDGASWMATDPDVHARLVTAKNAECDGRFVPFVKMVKGINRHGGDPISPSFLIEVMALELVLTPFGRYPDEIRFFLASMADNLHRNWPDPADLGNDVNASATAAARDAAVRAVRDWETIADRALRQQEQGAERAAVGTWRELFGNRMSWP